ncbi:MAG TPA: hypothetical protein VHH35_08595 [Pyrinomonadaceae bacterium]|nr:hypothetical protein [Pyrinomonadaceae bacterium]
MFLKAVIDESHKLSEQQARFALLQRLVREHANEKHAEDLWPRWWPDGKRIVFSSNCNGKFAPYEFALTVRRCPVPGVNVPAGSKWRFALTKAPHKD